MASYLIIVYKAKNEMEYKIKFKPELSAVYIHGVGEVSRKGIRDFHYEYLNDKRWEPGMNVIIDFRELSFKKFKPTDIQFIKDLVVGSREQIGNGKMAIIISSVNDFGLARMWEMKTESFVDFSVTVFFTREDALEWIKVREELE